MLLQFKNGDSADCKLLGALTVDNARYAVLQEPDGKELYLYRVVNEDAEKPILEAITDKQEFRSVCIAVDQIANGEDGGKDSNLDIANEDAISRTVDDLNLLPKIQDGIYIRSVKEIPEEMPSPETFPADESEEETTFLSREERMDPVLYDITTGEQYAVTKNPFTIGKLESNDLVIPVKEVSRHHAEIQQYGDKLFIQDTNSTNGTFVNGNRVPSSTAVELKNGQTLTFANCKYTIRW